MTWKNRANASTFIVSSPVKSPRAPIGEGHSARWRAFVIPRPIMSIVTNVARPVPARAKVQRRSGRFRQAKPRTAEASAVMTRIVSGRKTVYSDSSETSENALGPGRDQVENEDRQDAEHGEGDGEDREGRDLEAAEGRHRLPFRVWRPEEPRTAPRPYPPPALKPYTPAAIPRVTNPMWLTLENATSRFRSSWTMQTKAPYRIEMIPTSARSQYRSPAAVGSICTLNRMSP